MDDPKVKADIRPVLRRVLGNTGMLLGGRVTNAVLGLAYTALGARALGVEGFGVLVLIHAFAQFLGDVVKFESWQTVLQYGAKPLADGRRTDFQRVLRFTLILDLVSTVIALLVGVGVAFLFADSLGWSDKEALDAALYVLSAAFMVSAAPIGLMRLFDRFDVMAYQTALVSLVRLIGSGLAYVFSPTIGAFLLAWGAGTFAGFVYLSWQSWAELRRRDLLAGFPWKGAYTEGMPGAWKFAWNTNLASALDVAFTHVVTLMVGALLGPAQAALWRVGRQVADAMAKPARLLLPALYPEFARLRHEKDQGLMWRLGLQVALWAGGVSTLLLIVSLFAGEPLLTLLMGKAFAPAADVMTWQVAAAVVGIFALPLEPLLVLLGFAGTVVRVRIVGAVIYLAILPFLVERYGINGAGAGLLIATAALGLGMLWRLLRRRRKAAPEEPACDPDASA